MDYKQILDNIENGTCITPDNESGENKYNKQVKSLCDFLGFTKGRFESGSRIYKRKNYVIITDIYTKGQKEHTGFFKHLCQQFQLLGYNIAIENPVSERMLKIMQRHNYRNFYEEAVGYINVNNFLV